MIDFTSRKYFMATLITSQGPVVKSINHIFIGGFHCHAIKNKNGNLIIQKVSIESGK